MWHGVSPVPVPMWHGVSPVRCRCGGVSPVSVQMWLPVFSLNAAAGCQLLRCASAALWTLWKVASGQPVLQQSTTWKENALMTQRMQRAPSPSRWACAIKNCRSSLNTTCQRGTDPIAVDTHEARRTVRRGPLCMAGAWRVLRGRPVMRCALFVAGQVYAVCCMQRMLPHVVRCKMHRRFR